MTEVIIKKGKEHLEKRLISGKTVKRKAFINKDGILVEEWDIPAELSEVPFVEIAKKFKKVRRE